VSDPFLQPGVSQDRIDAHLDGERWDVGPTPRSERRPYPMPDPPNPTPDPDEPPEPDLPEAA
jgi:hypothetical protein